MGQQASKAASNLQSSLPANATPAVRALAKELSSLNETGTSIIEKSRAAKKEWESAAETLERKKAFAAAEEVIVIELYQTSDNGALSVLISQPSSPSTRPYEKRIIEIVQ